MLIDLKASMAYICPFCSDVTTRNINIFKFSGSDSVNFRCSHAGCRTDCISVRKKNSKYIVNIDCPICGDKHSFTLSVDRFWSKKLLTLSCPVSGMEIFFLGGKKDVKDALEKKTDELADFIGDEFDFDEPEILYNIILRVNELAAKNQLSCVCGNEHIEFSMLGDKIALLCPRCGRNKIIEASEENLEQLLKANSLIISN